MKQRQKAQWQSAIQAPGDYFSFRWRTSRVRAGPTKRKSQFKLELRIIPPLALDRRRPTRVRAPPDEEIA